MRWINPPPPGHTVAPQPFDSISNKFFIFLPFIPLSRANHKNPPPNIIKLHKRDQIPFAPVCHIRKNNNKPIVFLRSRAIFLTVTILCLRRAGEAGRGRIRMPGSADHQPADASQAERCYMFPDTRTAVLRGHTRSASHGAAALPSALQTRSAVPQPDEMGSTSSITSRPSAMKKGHQRAFSHGQIGTNDTTSSAGLSRGHARVGSRTEFILPPGHRDEPPPPRPRADSVHFKPGHSRQASRSESIYTLRNQPPPKWTDKVKIVHTLTFHKQLFSIKHTDINFKQAEFASHFFC